MPASFDIEMSSDIAGFINRLEKFDKETSKKLKAGMKDGVDYVVKAAKERVGQVRPAPPLSKWGYSWVEQDRTENVRNLVWNTAKAKSQIKPAAYRARKRGATVAFGYQAVQKNPAASIFELAGSKTTISKSTRGGSYTFNRSIRSRFGSGPYPRILYPAYYEGMPKARAEIEKALQEARRAVGL